MVAPSSVGSGRRGNRGPASLGLCRRAPGLPKAPGCETCRQPDVLDGLVPYAWGLDEIRSMVSWLSPRRPPNRCPSTYTLGGHGSPLGRRAFQFRELVKSTLGSGPRSSRAMNAPGAGSNGRRVDRFSRGPFKGGVVSPRQLGDRGRCAGPSVVSCQRGTLRKPPRGHRKPRPNRPQVALCEIRGSWPSSHGSAATEG